MYEASDRLRRAVFLDRDGVLNRAFVRNGTPHPPDTLAELEILPGVESALTDLHRAGWLLIVVTNQPDVARGKTTREQVDAMNAHLQSCLPLDEFRTCYHDSTDHCLCRKPQPGALIAAAACHAISLPTSFMVGDRWRDIKAGQHAGCKTIFIDYNYAEKQPQSFDYKASSLRDAADIILGVTPLLPSVT